MLDTRQSPAETYRKVELDARIEGTNGPKLGLLCLDAVIDALDRALAADSSRASPLRRSSLVKANTVALGLLRSVDTSNSTGAALAEFYRTASHIIAQSMKGFDAETIGALRDDFSEISVAMKRASP